MEKQKRNEFKHLWHWSVCVRVCPHSHRHACIHACTLLKCQGKAVLCLWQYHLLEVFICVQPVIPMFTENCREVFRTPQFGRSMCMWGGGACVCVCVCACVCVCVCVCTPIPPTFESWALCFPCILSVSERRSFAFQTHVYIISEFITFGSARINVSNIHGQKHADLYLKDACYVWKIILL